MLMPSAWAPWVPPSASACPATVTVPASGCTAPAMIPIIVDLPAPFSPTRATTSPWRNTRPGTSSTVTGPYVLRTPVRTRSPPAPATTVCCGSEGTDRLVVGDVLREVRLGERADAGADLAVSLERLDQGSGLRRAEDLH